MYSLLSFYRLIRFAGRFGALAVLCVTARALTVDPGNGDAVAGISSSLAMVGGRPAIAYADGSSSAVKFVRAADARGMVWETPVTVDAASPVGGRVFLLNVNGNPAVCYLDFSAFRIKFSRSLDTVGSTWGTAATLNTTGVFSNNFSATVVDGRPAVCYVNGLPDSLKFLPWVPLRFQTAQVCPVALPHRESKLRVTPRCGGFAAWRLRNCKSSPSR
jgi:hypothetical protein